MPGLQLLRVDQLLQIKAPIETALWCEEVVSKHHGADICVAVSERPAGGAILVFSGCCHAPLVLRQKRIQSIPRSMTRWELAQLHPCFDISMPLHCQISNLGFMFCSSEDITV